jgi:hypothetical protein
VDSGGSDNRVDGVVLRHGSDNDGGGGHRGGGWAGGDMVQTVEEKQDGVVPGRGDGLKAVRVVAMWTQQRRRGSRKFLQPDGVQVKILRLGFKDWVAGGFLGGPQ